MPGFSSRSEALAKGMAYRSGMTLSEEDFKHDAALAKTGATIAGMTGYACVTCHANGEIPAVQAFEGQGPNLQVSGERLRPGFYHSWIGAKLKPWSGRATHQPVDPSVAAGPSSIHPRDW